MHMKFINIILLVFVCSCVDPSSLDDLELYATNKLEHNINEFADAELRKWWDDYFKSQAMLVLANGKAFETTINTISRTSNNDQKSSFILLSELIKLYELNLSLKTLGLQSEEIEKNWKAVCQDNKVAEQIGLRNSILNNYINGLKLPTMAETYMIGGGNGEDGISKMFESITTNLGSLFNHDKIQRIKKKIKRIKSLFREKTPSEEQLAKRSNMVCLQSADSQRLFLEGLQPLINKMKESSKLEWQYYQSQKSSIGNLLLQRNLSKNDKDLEEKLGNMAKIHLLTNLAIMRQHLLLLIAQSNKNPTIENKENLQDFFIAFESQLNLIKSLPYEGLNEVIQSYRAFLNSVKGRNL